MATHIFDLAKYRLTIPDPNVEGDRAPMVPLTSIELRELTGEDELAAIDRARALAPSGREPTGTEVFEENITAALVRVNGQDVPGPAWHGHQKWRAKVRDFLRMAFRAVNDASQEDLEDFKKAALGLAGGQPTRGMSSTGSGSPGT